MLLEAEWVLRSGYGFTAERIVEALRGLGGLPGVTFEDAALVSQALDWAEEGVEFADALHLARARGCSAFMSFDRRLAKATAGLSAVKVTAP